MQNSGGISRNAGSNEHTECPGQEGGWAIKLHPPRIHEAESAWIHLDCITALKNIDLSEQQRLPNEKSMTSC